MSILKVRMFHYALRLRQRQHRVDDICVLYTYLLSAQQVKKTQTIDTQTGTQSMNILMAKRRNMKYSAWTMKVHVGYAAPLSYIPNVKNQIF